MGKQARRARTIASAMALFLAAAPLSSAHAQTDDATTAPAKKPKKPKKPKAAPTPPPAETPPPAPPVVEPAPPPPAPEPAPVATPAPPTAAPEEFVEPITNVYEKPGQTYYFVGARYRGTVIPKFMLNLFVDEGKTIYSNSAGIEFEVRRDGFSMIPWLVYSEYGTGGDMLFHQKNNPSGAGNAQYYSDVNSSLKSVYAGVNLKWSKDISKNLDFEYGAGFGLGVIFGTLTNDWVFESSSTTPGALKGSDGIYYSRCATTADAPSCNPGAHNNATTNKVGGYQEKNWFGGGSIPVFFPHISIPELGLRYKPIKELETRFSVGFSLTGFFFQLSASYGLEKRTTANGPEPTDKSGEKADKPQEDKPQPKPESE